MEIIYNKEINETKAAKLTKTKKTAVALGNFDGFHIGHMKLIDRIKEYSRENNISSCVWTFTEHSLNILNSGHAVEYITTREDKIGILKNKKIDYLIFQDFNSVKHLSPEEFIEKIIVGYLNAEFAVCGYDYGFGKNRAGTAEYLRKSLSEKNIESEIIPPVIYRGEAVSSSYVRSLIKNGDMQSARKLLGRPFSINFPVVYGRQIGRKIGIPTINQLFPPGHIIPACGIYVCSCEVKGIMYKAVTNIGVKPTVNNTATRNSINSETHLIDFSGDLYDRNIKVNFYSKFRNEIKFDSLDELKMQIQQDIEFARKYEF